MGLGRKSPAPILSDEEAGLKSGEETPKTRRRNGSSSGSGSSGKNGRSRKLGGWRLRPLLTLAACTMVFGPMGTFLTFMLLPDDHVWRLRQSQVPPPLPRPTLTRPTPFFGFTSLPAAAFPFSCPGTSVT